jgi:O-antigen ligase
MVGALYAVLASNRTYDFSGSGRLEGYLKAFEFVLENPFLGAWFSVEYYQQFYNVLPHNMFIYILTMGGFLSFALFLFWLLSFFLSARNNTTPLKLALLVVLVGTQFVPSIFSAYFIGALLSFSFLEFLISQQSSEVFNSSIGGFHD